jgi:hypothetical protein
MMQINEAIAALFPMKPRSYPQAPDVFLIGENVGKSRLKRPFAAHNVRGRDPQSAT